MSKCELLKIKEELINLYLEIKIQKQEDVIIIINLIIYYMLQEESISKKKLEKEKSNLKYISSLDLINYIKSTINILSILKEEEKKTKNEINKNENISEDYESLLIKEEAAIRQHIALENKLKLEYEIMTEKINSLEMENELLKEKIKKQMRTYENRIEEISKEITNLTNIKNDIQKSERKLRKKLDLKEKEIFQLQLKLNSINNINNINNGIYSKSSNMNKVNSNINLNSSFYGRDDCLKDFKKIQNNKMKSNNNSIDKINITNSNNEIISNKGRNKNFSSIDSVSGQNIYKNNSMSKANNNTNILFEKESLFNENNVDYNIMNSTDKRNKNIVNGLTQNNKNYKNHYINDENISIIKKIKENSNNNNINNNGNYKNNLNNISDNNKYDNDNIILGNSNYGNNSIDIIKVEQKDNNYKKLNNTKLLLITQNKNNKIKRTHSAINIKNNVNHLNNIHHTLLHIQNEKLKNKRDITPDKASNGNQNLSNSILKLNDNSKNGKYYLIKKSPRNILYKNSMPNIKGIDSHHKNKREINKFQYLSNKISNYKISSHSNLKANEYQKISSQDRINNDNNIFNFNNTNIINNKIIQKEGNINNNIIIINGEIVKQNNDKDEYPIISINRNYISLKKVSFKNSGLHDFSKIKK